MKGYCKNCYRHFRQTFMENMESECLVCNNPTSKVLDAYYDLPDIIYIGNDIKEKIQKEKYIIIRDIKRKPLTDASFIIADKPFLIKNTYAHLVGYPDIIGIDILPYEKNQQLELKKGEGLFILSEQT